MTRFRKKPVEIEAQQMTGSAVDCMKVAEWVHDNGYPWLVGNALQPETLIPEDGADDNGSGIWLDPADGALVIRTLEGDMRVTYGDWVIKGVQCEFYPCKPDIFAATYEPVGQQPMQYTDQELHGMSGR